MSRFRKISALIFSALILSSCANGFGKPIDTTMLPAVTEKQTEPETTAPDTTAQETTAPETTETETLEPETEVYLIFDAQPDQVWMFEEEMPEIEYVEPVDTVIVDKANNTYEAPEDMDISFDLLLDFPLIDLQIPSVTTPPENSLGSLDGMETDTADTDSSDNNTGYDPLKPIERPSRDDYTTDGQYSPIVMMYHSVIEEPFTSLESLFVRPSEFEQHLQTINAMGYEYGFADEFTTSDKPTVMLTFDDGYTDNYTEVFPLLKKYNAKATIFMVAGAINAPGYLTSEQIKEMADSGLVHFGSHTASHFNLTSLTEDKLHYEFSISKSILESITGMPVTSVCYPGGRVSDEIARLAEEYYCFGYTTVNSAVTAGCDPMLVPRARISRGMTGESILRFLIY